VNYQGDIGNEAENLFLLKFLISSFIKILSEISYTIELLDHAQMASIIKKIVNDFDDKWMRVLSDEPDFLMNCLNFTLIQEINLEHRPFESELLLIMLPYGFKYSGEATLSD
jgi:hypothetical protein